MVLYVNGILAQSSKAKVSSLSGGNIRKVVVDREAFRDLMLAAIRKLDDQ